MNIGIDVDDVLARFNEGWLEYHNELYKTDYRFDQIIDYDYSVFIDLPGEIIMNRIEDFYKTEGFKNLKTVEGSISGIDNLSSHKLYVITSRPETFRNETINWLDKNFPKKFNDIILTNQFNRVDGAKKITKGEVAKKLKLKYMIEDAPHHAEDLIESGIGVLLLEKPWNKNAKVSNKVKRVKHWDDVRENLV